MKMKLIMIVMAAVFVVVPGTMAQETEVGSGHLQIKESASSSTPQLLLEQAGTGDASIEFNRSLASTVYSTGIDAADLNYKTTNTGNLTGGLASAQGDGITLILARPNGIIDFNNQSRARASLNHPQFVPFNAWTPIEFDDDFTILGGYDQQREFMLWTPLPTPAVFVPLTQGFYQIHARTAFEFVDPSQPIPGYVSISIFVNGVIYAQGNNLQMTAGPEILFFNNAPNVSDVVWLLPGDNVEICVLQTIDGVGVVSLVMGPSQTYVSIHKDS